MKWKTPRKEYAVKAGHFLFAKKGAIIARTEEMTKEIRIKNRQRNISRNWNRKCQTKILKTERLNKGTICISAE
jgi:hypothetical protein